VHQITPRRFFKILEACSMSRGTIDQKHVETMLVMVRDILMCFTMCQREGKYRDDKALGKFVEDQPFSLAFRPPGDNVFDEDDCEGHDQHGCVHVKGLFQQIARDAEENRFDNVMKHLDTETKCLQISNTETMLVLLKICTALGQMFSSKQLDAIMAVGEANFASFAQVKASGQCKKKEHLDPHSFGLLLFRRAPNSSEIQGSMILETTGWENRGFGSHNLPPKAKQIMKDVIQFSAKNSSGEPQDKIILRCIFDEEQEDKLYRRVFAGDDCLFFTFNVANGKLSYGASPSHIFKNTKIYSSETKEEIRASADGKEVVVLAVSPERFFKALSSASSPWGRHQGAEQRLDDYLRIKAMYPSFHQRLMPPQITEEEFLGKMARFWGEIKDEDLERIREANPSEKTIAFSCRVDTSTRAFSENIQNLISNLSENSEISTHDFMQSKLFVVRV
jgi:hypothetical protein